MAGNQGGGGSVFEIPLSLNQTPVSGTGSGGNSGGSATGAFFSASPEGLFSGGGNSGIGLSVAVMAGAAVLVALILRG